MDTSTNSKNTPVIYFKFTPLSGQDALDDIKNHTEQFNSKYGITDDFVKELTNRLTNTPSVLRGFLNAPTDSNITRQVIGKGGCYFHLTTQNCNIDFIWHDRNSNKFLFWGDKFPLIHAMKQIQYRINKHSN